MLDLAHPSDAGEKQQDQPARPHVALRQPVHAVLRGDDLVADPPSSDRLRGEDGVVVHELLVVVRRTLPGLGRLRRHKHRPAKVGDFQRIHPALPGHQHVLRL